MQSQGRVREKGERSQKGGKETQANGHSFLGDTAVWPCETPQERPYVTTLLGTGWVGVGVGGARKGKQLSAVLSWQRSPYPSRL